MALDRAQFVYEVVDQRRQADGLLSFEYRVWESGARRTAGDRPVLLNSHRAQFRETHQRIATDAQGRWLHQSGAAVAPEDLAAFLADPPDPPPGGWPPFVFPNYWGVDEELDGQWQRETFTVPIDDQVAEAVGRFLNRADRAAAKKFGRELERGRTLDFRGTTLNLQVGASADDAFQQTDDSVSITALSGLSDATTEHIGTRFRDVTISNTATIDMAIYTVYVGGTSVDEPIHRLQADDSDTAAIYTTGSNDIDARARTTALNDWDVTDLATSAAGFVEWGSAASDPTNGADIDTIIAEVIARAGWASGGALALICQQFSSSSTRDLTIHFYDVNTAQAAKLDIDYTGGVTTHNINAALSGTGTLSATVNLIIPIAATLAGTGTLSATVNLIIPVTAALSGTGALSATVSLIAPIEAALSGAGTLSATVNNIIPIAAALSGTGTVTADLQILNITAALTGDGTLSAAVTLIVPIAAALSGAGTLSATVDLIIPIEAALTGAGTLSATVNLIVPIEAALTGTGTLAADVSLIIPIAAALSGTGDLSAAVDVLGVVDIAAALSGTGTLAADVSVISAAAPPPSADVLSPAGLHPGGRYPTLINFLDYYLPAPAAVRPLPITATLPGLRARLAVPRVELADQRSAWAVVMSGAVREPTFSGYSGGETRAAIHAVAVGTAQAAVPGVMDWRAYDLHTRQLARYAENVRMLEWQHAEARVAWDAETQRQVRETEEALAVLLL